MEFRLLTAEDAQGFQVLRLRALREHPEAFGMSFETVREIALAKVAEGLSQAPVDGYWLGAFEQAELLGFLRFGHRHGEKLKHKAAIGEMYVKPEARGRGIGRASDSLRIHQAM